MDASDLAAVALTTRIVASSTPPLTAAEFWRVARAGELSVLTGRNARDLDTQLGIGSELAERIARLLERGTSLALALEQLEHSGTWTLTGVGDRYPPRLLARLGDAAPPTLHGVGNADLLHAVGIGVVGSRDIDADGVQVARDVATAVVDAALPVVSGGARGVDQQAMNAAFERGGCVVGVLAGSLEKAVAKPSTRQAVVGGQICLVTPFAPSAPFSTGLAMGRNKVIYGLARAVVVICSDEGSGGTWAGATEALRRKYTQVIAWTGTGSTAGNRALVGLGAIAMDDLADLPELVAAQEPKETTRPRSSIGDDQLSLF